MHKAFRFLDSHKDFKDLAPKVKGEIELYKTIINEIPPLSEREDEKGHDTFDIAAFWQKAQKKLPATSRVLRGVLVHSPNSAPPERVFSILNDSFDDDQSSALNDYLQLSMQLQYNERGRSRGA